MPCTRSNPETIDDLAGREVVVRVSSSYYQSLQALSERLVSQGLSPINVVPAHEIFEDEDLLEMASVGMLGVTVVDDAVQGRVEFPNSGTTEAQQDFVEGVLYLHNFEYEDAANAFRRAQEIDPLFALAYWGEAMTKNRPIWMQQDRDAANEVLGRYAGHAGPYGIVRHRTDGVKA